MSILVVILTFAATGLLLKTALAAVTQNGFGTTIRHVGSPTPELTCPDFPPTAANNGCLAVISAVVVADFNGDSKADVAVNGTKNHFGGVYGVHVLLGNGDGTFQADTFTPTHEFFFPILTNMVAADFNMDGKVDLFADSVGSTARVLLGIGDGTFSVSAWFFPPNGINNAVVGDFNGDSKPDVAVGAVQGATVYLGNGNGTFAAPVSYLGLPYSVFRRIAIGDFNGDNIADLVTINPGNATTEMRLGNGNGTFQTPLISGTTFGNLSGLSAVADLNGDGKADLVLGQASGFTTLIGNGDGTFLAGVFHSAGAFGASNGLRLGVLSDFNSDGKTDVLMGDGNPALGQVILFSGNGNGTFQAPVAFSSGLGSPFGNGVSIPPTVIPGSGVLAMGLGEFNGDGRVDLVTGGDNPHNRNVNFLTTVLGAPGVSSTVSTTTTLVSSPNPSLYGQSVTLSATVTPSTATGTVTFKDGTTTIGTGTLVSGGTTFPTSALSVGSHALTAVYGGDTGHLGSTGSLTQTVNQATSSVTVTCPSTPQIYTGAAQTPCAASFTTSDGLSGSLTVSYTTNTNVGTAGASATYAGDANHASSSNNGSFTIAQASSTTLVTCPASMEYTGGVLTPCSVAVTGVGGLSLMPAPTYANNTNVGTASASYTYTGDPNHTGSSNTRNFAIVDTTPPAIGTVTPNPGSLWPPNHKMVNVTVVVIATDLRPTTCMILPGTTSNEPDNGQGDGDTAGDIGPVSANGQSISLRAERGNNGPGRIYTLTVSCTDGITLPSTKTAQVTVPKSQGK